MSLLFRDPDLFNPRLIVPAVREEFDGDTFRGLVIDTRKASYHGKPWRDLSNFERRKFENLLVIKFPEQPLKFRYA